MTIRVNGEERAFNDEALTVETLIARLGLAGRPLIVELNGRALVRSEWPAEPLRHGDRVEIVRLAAGG